MSDFLSKFSGDHYNDLLKKDKQTTEDQVANKPTPSSDQAQNQPPSSAKERAIAQAQEGRSRRERLNKTSSNNPDTSTDLLEEDDARTSSRRDDSHEQYEIDPTYKKRQQRKRLIWIASGSLGLLLTVFLIYRLTHVALPNFVGQSISEVRAWGVKNNVDFAIEQEYDLEYEVNQVISQAIQPKKQVRKGSSVNLTVSLGANPDELLNLPDFSSMTNSEAEEWIKKNRADNLKLTLQYDETIPANHYIRLDITSSGVTASDYKRGDKAIVYYSRGKEVLEKNIDVPDFAGKQKSEVESWAKSNGIDMTYTDQASDSIAAGTIISQSITSGQKVAKKDKMEVFVSAGKGITVPDFSTVTPETAADKAPGLTVTVLYQLDPDIRYGTLISQSIEAGKQLTEKENKQIQVIYSQGAPYLKDLRGKNASELAKYFYEEYRSRGADITYETYWVDSSQPKGTVVAQSDYETEISMYYHVYIGISNGAWAGQSSYPQNQGGGSEAETVQNNSTDQ